MAAVSPNLLEREETWDPQVFCGGILPLLSLPDERVVTIDGVDVVEGQRSEEGLKNPGPIYRVSNVGGLELGMDSEHYSSPVSAGDRCVVPGDIVVSKIAPVRASIATSSVFRHPVDANCCIVRGLGVATGFWFALCINQPAFGEYLVRKSGAAIVPRVAADALKSIRLPKPPAAIAAVSHRVNQCIERRLLNQVELFRFFDIVRKELESLLPESSNGKTSIGADATTWFRFFPPADIEDSWVPGHVAVNGYQRHLKRDAGWNSIRYLTAKSLGGRRITDSGESVCTLLLSDVDDDLTVTRSQMHADVSASRRVYAEPLQADEVLLSALVTRPRVVFVGQKPSRPIHPTDHWHRLRFHETPGAWAAVLNDAAIHEQLGRLAIGTVQQFAPPWTISKLVLPGIPLETRRKWDAFLRRWQQNRLDIQLEWVRLMSDAYELLRETHRDCGSWSVPPAVFDGENCFS